MALFEVRSHQREALDAVSRHARSLVGSAADDAELMRLLGRAEFALLGEASHGSDEFYRERAAITKRLIVEHGTVAVAVEADWPDALRVNRYVRGLPGDADGSEALAGFRRFPTWMWRNTAVLEFVEWLRGHNARLPPADRVGFYGIDLYSLFGSIHAVLAYLDREDPPAAWRARRRYACFEAYREDAQAYGYATRFGMSPGCEDAVVAQLQEMLAQRAAQATLEARADDDARFHAEQNARLVRNAERYYRTMFGSRVASWNLRDRHMVETLEALRHHLGTDRAAPPRIAVWAHNSHLGDARATELGEAGEWNVGQAGCASATATPPCCSASPPTMAASPPPATGTARSRSSSSSRAWPAAGKRCTTTPASPASPCCCAAAASWRRPSACRACSGRSA